MTEVAGTQVAGNVLIFKHAKSFLPLKMLQVGTMTTSILEKKIAQQREVKSLPLGHTICKLLRLKPMQPVFKVQGIKSLYHGSFQEELLYLREGLYLTLVKLELRRNIGRSCNRASKAEPLTSSSILTN